MSVFTSNIQRIVKIPKKWKKKAPILEPGFESVCLLLRKITHFRRHFVVGYMTHVRKLTFIYQFSY